MVWSKQHNIIITHVVHRVYNYDTDYIGFGAGGAGGGRLPRPPLFGPGGARGAHHFELQPLVCIVCSGKVRTLTQQCIAQITKVTTNSQQES